MKAASATRKGWAVNWGRSPAPADVPVRRAAGRVLLRIAAWAALVLAVGGFAVTLHDDRRQEAERYAALRNALGEFRAVYGDAGAPDFGELTRIGERTGLRDLRFNAEPVAEAGRETQPLLDANGRITGWLSWLPDRALVRVMYWLWGLLCVVGCALVLSIAAAERQERKLILLLGRNLETVRKLAAEDTLTGLPNRRAMVESLDRMLAIYGASGVVFALIDLDNFREINDTLGRAGGDAVLAKVAGYLKADLPSGALFGRFESDEFAVATRRDDAQAADRLADTLHASLALLRAGDAGAQVSAGIGVAQAPGDGRSSEELVRRAGLALRAAKREGFGIARRFEPRIEIERAERRFLLRELETAITLETLEVHYQPIVSADRLQTIGVEALLRWPHPTRGMIPPSEFVPLAEQSGRMLDLGKFVLRRALTDGARWPDLSIAVNLSPLQIRDRKLVDVVAAVLAESGVDPSRVVLEVTEGTLIDDPQEAKTRLDALHALGVSIALDDFGTGYSSLSYLQKFPFNVIKIDRAFVASLGTTANTGAIIQSIVTLGHALGMKVLAEGVETDEQRVLLRLAGCDELQGYLFARPVTAATIDETWAQPTAARAVARSKTLPPS